MIPLVYFKLIRFIQLKRISLSLSLCSLISNFFNMDKSRYVIKLAQLIHIISTLIFDSFMFRCWFVLPLYMAF